MSPVPPASLIPCLASISAFVCCVAPVLSPGNSKLPFLKLPVFYPPDAPLILFAGLPLVGLSLLMSPS